MYRQPSLDIDADRFGPAMDDMLAVTRRSLLVAPRVQAIHRALCLAERRWTAAEFEHLDRESRPWRKGLASELRLTLD